MSIIYYVMTSKHIFTLEVVKVKEILEYFINKLKKCVFIKEVNSQSFTFINSQSL